MATDDMELVRDYAARQSEPAFETLVARYVNLIYSAALRQVGDPHLAEEVTQAVFIILARKAGSLGAKTILPSWLHRTACYTAADALKIQRRRAQREQEAHMQSLLNEPENETWTQIAPLLDTAIAGLNEKDRHAIVLRFFEKKSMSEVGQAIGANENAAKTRVNRALEKLRKFFSKRGVTISATAIAGAVAANSVQAAPVGLVVTISAGKGAAVGGSTLTLVKGTSKLMAWVEAKTAIVVAGVLVTSGVITIAIADKDAHAGQPDPVALLKKVAIAREKIKSGELEIIVARHDFKWAIQTNYSLLKIVFDGEKRRLEQLQRESAYVSTDPDAQKLVDAKRVELGGDDDALAQLGLIELQDAHYRTIYDGKTLTQFDPRMDANINDPKEGSWGYRFNPRILGLSDSLFVENTVENCLAYKNAQSVSLIGKESVGGIVAWHIKVQIADDWRYEFWIDATHPTRVVKQEAPNRSGTVLSTFDDQHPDDPIPIAINIVNHFGGDPRPWETRMILRNSRYNVPIDPKAWTLAGLGMSIGTPVVDVRIHRRIGYWTGSNLMENLPRNTPRRPNHVASIMENSPESLASVKTDGSFVDERKIILRRMEVGVVLFVFVLITGLAVKRLWASKHSSSSACS